MSKERSSPISPRVARCFMPSGIRDAFACGHGKTNQAIVLISDCISMQQANTWHLHVKFFGSSGKFVGKKQPGVTGTQPKAS